MANMFSVISPSYSASDSVNLQINTENRVIYNIDGDVVFYAKDTSSILHKRRVLCDDKGNPIVTLHKKVMSLQGRCQVFTGKSNDPSQLLFSVKDAKKSSKIPPGKFKLNIFLADNKDENSCDFRVIIDGNKISCSVYAGESPTIVAKMENNGGFNVLVYPNVDYAFIVALLMIVNEMKNTDLLYRNSPAIAGLWRVVTLVSNLLN